MKHKFSGIGATGASVIMAGLAANPATLFLTQGFLGKVVFLFLKYFCETLANAGLIVLNIGAARMETMSDEKYFDGSWETAEELIQKIRNEGRDLTDEEIKAIDDEVIIALRRFASFGKLRKRKNS